MGRVAVLPPTPHWTSTTHTGILCAMIKLVISGGQSGADQAGWRAAQACDIPTGGWMPFGFLTEEGPQRGSRTSTVIGRCRLRAIRPGQSRTSRKATVRFGSAPPTRPERRRRSKHASGCVDPMLVIPSEVVLPLDVLERVSQESANRVPENRWESGVEESRYRGAD